MYRIIIPLCFCLFIPSECNQQNPDAQIGDLLIELQCIELGDRAQQIQTLQAQVRELENTNTNKNQLIREWCRQYLYIDQMINCSIGFNEQMERENKALKDKNRDMNSIINGQQTKIDAQQTALTNQLSVIQTQAMEIQSLNGQIKAKNDVLTIQAQKIGRLQSMMQELRYLPRH